MEKLVGRLLGASLFLVLLGSFIFASALQTDVKVIHSTGSVSYDPPPPPPGPNDPPVAVAGVNPTSGTVNGYFTLSSDLSYDPDGYIASYHWNFGNGATSTSANPRYAYPSTGTYTITLTVTDDDGATDSDSVTVQVYSQPPPKHAFSITSTPITSIAFTINGMIYSTPYSGTEMAEGYYNVTAPRYVETGGIYYEFVGWSDTPLSGEPEVSRLVYLDKDTSLEMQYQDTSEPPPPPGPNQPPVASASVSPSGGTVDTVFGFSSAGSVDSDGSIASYSWSFGDGGTSASANPTHVYSSAGTYTASLTVTDDDGATDSDSVSVTVSTTPPPTYVLAVATVGQGAVARSPDQSSYDSGTMVQLTASPASGWVFSGWSGDLTGTANPATVTMDSDKSVTATFIYDVGTDTSDVFIIENTNGADDGFDRMINIMGSHNLHFYSLIGADDVVIVKVNCQWNQRGGTNTDLLKSIIQAIVDHPDGFTGEVVVADNGQDRGGSGGYGGSLDWAESNAVDHSQSAQDVVDTFSGTYKVSTYLWDAITNTQVDEYSTGDMDDGFVVNETENPRTDIMVSYPKFETDYGTYVSFRDGIWNSSAGTYDSDRLKVINLPVLKSHVNYGVTASVKHYMGVPSDKLTSQISGLSYATHRTVGKGSMGTLMAETRMPVLNVLDAIWIMPIPEYGPRSYYHNAVGTNLILASTDPVALDYWASKNVLMPAARALGYTDLKTMDPDAGGFYHAWGDWLELSMQELQRTGFQVTNDPSQMNVYVETTSMYVETTSMYVETTSRRYADAPVLEIIPYSSFGISELSTLGRILLLGFFVTFTLVNINNIRHIHFRVRRNFFLVGLASLFWYLLRTGTKPSRASYPCQMAAAANTNVWGIMYVLPALAYVKRKARA